MMDDVITLSFYDSEMKSEEKKDRCATFKIQMKINCRYLKAEDDTMFNKR